MMGKVVFLCALWVQETKVERMVKDEAFECWMEVANATAVALRIGSRSEVTRPTELGR